MGSLVGPVADEIALQVQGAGTVSFYGLPYKAGDAKPATVLSRSYFKSKEDGQRLLHDYLAEVVAACPSMKLVVIGYSQGAHAAGDQLADEPTSITDHVAALVMFGDPRFNPDASYVWGTFDSRNYGLNGKRDINDFSSWNTRVFSFCNLNDPICQGVHRGSSMAQHDQALYAGNYSVLVAGLVRRRLGYPRPANPRTPLDLAFVIDTTGSMGSSIEGVKDAAANIARTLESRGSDFRIGLVDFKDHPDQWDPYASRLDLQMTSNATAFSNALDGLVADGGGDGPEAVYSGLMTAITDLHWRNVTRKAIILIGDAPAKDPEPVTGFTRTSVTNAARALDPATINPLVVGGAPTDMFQGLADDSGGTVFQANGSAEVTEQVLAAVDQAALPLYTSLTVSTPARPGTAVQFSAAGSYYDAGEIASYAWDFDNDGAVDKTTTGNRTTHVYSAPFSGLASVTVNTDDAHQASVTAAVDVRDDAPLPPSEPTALTATSKQPGSIQAFWQAPTDSGGGALVGYSAQIEHIASGKAVYSAAIPGSETAIEVVDLPSGSYRVRIYAVSEGGIGNSADRIVDVSPPATSPAPAPAPTPAPTPAPAPAPLPTPAPVPPIAVLPPVSLLDPPPFAAKLEVARARVLRFERRLSVLAPITGRASGEVMVAFRAAGRTERFESDVDEKNRRVRINRKIPASQARLGTGILTLTYGGDDNTQPQEVRLRAASRKADLDAERPKIGNDRLTAKGTITKRARGRVRLQLLYEPQGQQTRTLEFTAKIKDGRYRFDEKLPPDVVQGIANRRGVLHSYTLFTGYFEQRIRGEMKSFQVRRDR